MKKTTIIIALCAFVLLSAAALWGYWELRQRTLSDKTNLYTALSSRTALIVETKNLWNFTEKILTDGDFNSVIKNSLPDFYDFLKTIYLRRNGELRKVLSEREFLLVYNKNNDKLNGVLLGKITPKEAKIRIDSLINEISYRSAKIAVYSKFYTAYFNNIFIATPHLEEMKKTIDLLEDKAANLQENITFNAVRRTAGNNVLASLFVNTQALFPAFADKIKDDFPALKAKTAAFPQWLSLDLSLADRQLLANGYSNNADNFIYTDTVGADLQTLPSDLPANTAFFFYQHIGDYAKYKEKQSQQFNSDRFLEDFFGGDIVYAIADRKPLKQSSFVMLSIKDSTLAAERLEKAGKRSPRFSAHLLRDVNIYEIPRRQGLTAALDVVANSKEPEFAAFTGKYLLIADNADLLFNLAEQTLSGNTLAKDPDFRLANESCTDDLPVFGYVHFPSLLKYANEIFDDSLKINEKSLSSLRSIGWQMQNERGMIYHNAFLGYQKISTADTSGAGSQPVSKTEASMQLAPKTLWQTDFNKTVSFTTIIRNEATGADEILIQDTENNLYLFDNKGSQLWSAPLTKPILGNKIHQIDYYGNKKYQFIFNTAEKLYIIDRKGRNVEKYPLALPAEASAPLAVFDYDKKKDYRIFVPAQDKRIYLFKKDGTRPADWQFGKTAGIVRQPLQHFALDNKDYICVNDGEQAYFLNRKGEERIKPKSDFAPTGEFYLRGKYFYILDNQGYAKQIDPDGNVKSFPPASNEAAALKSETPPAYPDKSTLYMGKLKPLTNNCIISLGDGKITCYELK